MNKNEDVIKVENLSFPKNTFTIRWNMTKLCNYYCDFCIQGNKEQHLKDSKNENPKTREQVCDKIIEFIENKINNKFPKLRICLIGGEVTILKDFIKTLDKFINCKFNGDIEIQIKTNLSMKMSDIQKIKKIAKSASNNKYKRRISLTASYYKEFTTEKEFIKKVKTLHTNTFKQVFNYICNKKKANLKIYVVYPLVNDKDYKKYLAFKIRNILNADSIMYVCIRDYKQTISQKLKNKLTKKNIKKIKVTLKNGKNYFFSSTSQIGFILKDTPRFNPKGLVCDTGLYNVTINSDGMVSRCQTCRKETFVGNILEDNIELTNTKLHCKSVKCNCAYYKTIERK